MALSPQSREALELMAQEQEQLAEEHAVEAERLQSQVDDHLLAADKCRARVRQYREDLAAEEDQSGPGSGVPDGRPKADLSVVVDAEGVRGVSPEGLPPEER
jgi:hypothetical protein